MYCTCHSLVSIARSEGIPISIISEGIGHDSESTTHICLASLEIQVIDEANQKNLYGALSSLLFYSNCFGTVSTLC